MCSILKWNHSICVMQPWEHSQTFDVLESCQYDSWQYSIFRESKDWSKSLLGSCGNISNLPPYFKAWSRYTIGIGMVAKGPTGGRETPASSKLSLLYLRPLCAELWLTPLLLLELISGNPPGGSRAEKYRNVLVQSSFTYIRFSLISLSSFSNSPWVIHFLTTKPLHFHRCQRQIFCRNCRYLCGCLSR